MSLIDIFQHLLPGIGKTIGIFVCTLVFSMPLGLMIAFGRMSKCFIVRNVVNLYISVMRGTPLMLQLMVVY